jgi:hypothetical protein
VAGAGGAPKLSVVVGSVESACSGEAFEQRLRASGGEPPYAWRLVEAPAGVDGVVDGGELELSGVSNESGSVLVEVRDAAGQAAQAEALVIRERPQITTERLPALCADAAYAALLEASGGDSDAYAWSAALVSGEELPATLAELGLALDGEVLAGELLEPDVEGRIQIVLQVSDGVCSSPKVTLELEVVSGGSDECPEIVLADGTGGEALPPPCLGNGYLEALAVQGGEPPYTWRALAAPPGLFFDPDTATVEGVAESDGTLVVEVTDGNARSVQKRYLVDTRDSCWLAFIASEPGPARLELVDARLLQRQPALARRALPSEPSPDAVLDFEFSPDGRFIAYQLGQAPSLRRLEIARVLDGQARAVDVPGSVDAYAWSPNAATLAVAFSNGAGSFLGGVDVSGVDTSLAAVGAPLSGVRRLDASAAPPTASAPVWFGTGQLGYLGLDADAPERRRLVTSTLGASGFAEASPRAELSFSSGAALLGAAPGLFVADPESALHQFFPSGGAVAVPHGPGAVFTERGDHVALAQGGALGFFEPGSPSAAPAAPRIAVPECSALLSWDAASDRVACLDARLPGSLGVFQLLSDEPRAIELAPRRAADRLAPGDTAGRRRVFSPGGGWLAVAGDEALAVLRLDGGASERVLTLPTSELGTRPGALVFSPDERRLLVGAANSLGLVSLDAKTPALLPLSSSALLDEFCGEDFVNGASEWCGAASHAPSLAFSRGSDLVAFRSALGTLAVIDVSGARDGEIGEPISPDSTCSEACTSGQSAVFQP